MTTAQMTNINSLPHDRGGFVNLPDFAPNKDNDNGALKSPGGETIRLWITGVGIDFGMGGSFAQSHTKRTWFPRNFTMPVFNVEGVCANEAQYGQLAEHVRNCQLTAVTSQSDHILTFLRIRSGGMENVRSQRGKHQGFLVGGFIEGIDRIAQMGVNAPKWNFTFQAVSTDNTMLQSSRTRGRVLKAWTKIGGITPLNLVGDAVPFDQGNQPLSPEQIYQEPLRKG